MQTKETLNHVVYAGIKAELHNGGFRPGERLEGRVLEVRFDASSTPVRMALSRLAGERMVEQDSSDGAFRAPYITERWLAPIYEANDQILRMCLKRAGTRQHGPGPSNFPPDTGATDIGTETASLFLSIAAATRNAELVAIIKNLNDRLHLVRRSEADAVAGYEKECREMQAAWEAGDIPALATRIRQYHRMRLSKVSQIIVATDGKHGCF